MVFADDCVGDGVKKNMKDLREGDVLLLENLRFHKGEEKNTEDFARALADGVDVYVNDAFGTAHRAHASTTGMIRFVRDKGAGFLMNKELEHLGKALNDPARPFVAIVTFFIWIPAILFSGGLTHPMFVILAWFLIHQSGTARLMRERK